MVQDEPQEDDMVLEESGVKFAVEKKLFNILPEARIDYVGDSGEQHFIISGGWDAG